MLQAMRGILSEDPDVRPVRGPDGVLYHGVSLMLSYADDRTGAANGTCQLVAWNDQAEKLSHYQKGEEIEFIGRLHSNAPAPGRPSTLRFTLVHLDESKTLISAMESLFRERYIPKPQLFQQIRHAEKQKDQVNSLQEQQLSKEATP